MNGALIKIKQLARADNTTISHEFNGFLEIETSGFYLAQEIHYRAIQLGLLSNYIGTTVQVYERLEDKYVTRQESKPSPKRTTYNR